MGSISAFLGTLGLLIVSGISKILAVFLALPFALALFLVGQTIVPLLEDARQRRRRHRETVVQKGVVPTIDPLREASKRNLLEELRTLDPFPGRSTRREIPTSLQWRWLLKHDARANRAAGRLSKAHDEYDTQLSKAIKTIEALVVEEGWHILPQADTLTKRTIGSPLFAEQVLQAVAPPRVQLDALRSRETGVRNKDADIVVGHFRVARATSEEYDELVERMTKREAELLAIVAPLTPAHQELQAARREMTELLESLEAEGSVTGSCDACPPTFARRRST